VPTKHGMTKETYLKKLGKHITKLREEAGLSQSEFALMCDKDRQNINRLEKGKVNPTAYFLSEIAAELGVPVKKLLDFE
jgi:putative transcriptional regulator